MPLILYMDVHVPIVVTESLRRKGLDVLTSQDDGTATLDDETLLARANEMGRVLFSQDQDFLRIAAEWQRAGRTFRRCHFRGPAGRQPRLTRRRPGTRPHLLRARGTAGPGHVPAPPVDLAHGDHIGCLDLR